MKKNTPEVGAKEACAAITSCYSPVLNMMYVHIHIFIYIYVCA